VNERGRNIRRVLTLLNARAAFEIITPAITTLKQLPRTSVQGMRIKQNKSGL
jgi:hypothetical protein